MAARDTAATVTEYGIQTPNSKTILMVTEDLHEAERTLDLIGEGRLITRVVSYGPWRALDNESVA